MAETDDLYSDEVSSVTYFHNTGDDSSVDFVGALLSYPACVIQYGIEDDDNSVDIAIWSKAPGM